MYQISNYCHVVIATLSSFDEVEEYMRVRGYVYYGDDDDDREIYSKNDSKFDVLYVIDLSEW